MDLFLQKMTNNYLVLIEVVWRPSLMQIIRKKYWKVKAIGSSDLRTDDWTDEHTRVNLWVPYGVLTLQGPDFFSTVKSGEGWIPPLPSINFEWLIWWSRKFTQVFNTVNSSCVQNFSLIGPLFPKIWPIVLLITQYNTIGKMREQWDLSLLQSFLLFWRFQCVNRPKIRLLTKFHAATTIFWDFISDCCCWNPPRTL